MKYTIKLAISVVFAAVLVSAHDAYAVRPGKNKIRTVRFIDYNIADGMWYDQYDNYDRFVEWVKGRNPDILTICEGATHWDAQKKEVSKEQAPRYLPDSLSALAARWGHKYAAVGPYQDNYPVAVTSRYPIKVVQRIGDGLSHGAIHVKINGVNYVVLHLWPQRYSMGDATRSDGNGDAFRVGEMERILDSTIRNPRFSKEKHWVMTGDFNSHSPLDKPYHGKRNYDVHNLVRSVYPHDVIGELCPGRFEPSMVSGKSRLDYVYCTEDVFKAIEKAETVRDAFTDVASDHRPIMVEFKKTAKNK